MRPRLLLPFLIFLGVFFATTLPNNAPTTRLFVLLETPGLLFDWTLAAPPENPAERQAAQTRGLRYLSQRLPLAATAAFLLLTATALGRLTTRSLGLHRSSLSHMDSDILKTPVWLGSAALGRPQEERHRSSGGSRWSTPATPAPPATPPFRDEHDGLEVRRTERFAVAELWALETALGLSLWSLVVLGLGLAGLLLRPLFLGIGLTVIALETARTAWAWRSSLAIPSRETAGDGPPRTSFWETLTTTRFSGGTLTTWLRVGSLPFLAMILLGAALPSTDFDVNEYHFGGPKEYYLAGRIGFLEHNVYTSFPFLTEMLTLSAMVVHGDWYWGALAGKLLLSTYAILTALAVRAMARSWAGPLAGELAAFAWITTPWVFRISTIAYVEGALACYLALAWLVVADGRVCGTRALLAGLFAGSAMACKYPGLVQVVLPVGVALLAGAATRDWRRLGPLYIAGVALAIGPWLLKNFFETGNPVYPLGYTLFGGRDWDGALNAKWRAGHGSASFPVWGFLDGLFDVSVRNDWLSPLLYGGLVVALFRRAVGEELPVRRTSSPSLSPASSLDGLEVRRTSSTGTCSPAASLTERESRRQLLPTLLLLGWHYVAWWGLTHRLDRFWVPMLPLVAAVAGVGLAGLVQIGPTVAERARRVLVMGLLVAVAAFNGVVCGVGLAGYNDFLKDLPAARAYTARLVMPEIVWMNENLPPSAKVLCIGDAELFEATFTPVYNTVFDHSIFEQWCAGEGTDPKTKPLRPMAEIRRTLAERGITHVYVNWSELLRYRTTYTYTDFVAPERFEALVEGGLLSAPRTPDDAWQRVETLPDSWRNQVEKWGAALVREVNGERVIPQWSVYTVTGP